MTGAAVPVNRLQNLTFSCLDQRNARSDASGYAWFHPCHMRQAGKSSKRKDSGIAIHQCYGDGQK
jgi:hypothetical protein